MDYFTFDATGAYAPLTPVLSTTANSLVIDGTNATQRFTVHTENLVSDLTLSASAGFEVSPSTISIGSGDQEVTVTLKSTMSRTAGTLVLRSGDLRHNVELLGLGTPLDAKSLSENPVYKSNGEEADEEMSFDNFSPGDNGYTVEMRVRTDNVNKKIYPYAVTSSGVGFKAYVDKTGLGIYNSFGDYTSDKAFTNPATSVAGGSGAFYNDDNEYHTYRYSVTSDKRIFVYRDGLAIDTVRVADLALQPEFAVSDGVESENLLRNGNFEGEWRARKSDNLVDRIEGWNVYPLDQYNSTQEIAPLEISNAQDFNNHVLKMERYLWSDGWSAGQVSQIVDVAPNETYEFRAMAKGGIWGDNGPQGKILLYDLQNANNKVTIPVTSDDFKEYIGNITTQANTKQVKVEFYLERGKWGSRPSALIVDDAVLEGRSRAYADKIGFSQLFADVDYFTFDATGAYAPMDVALDIDNITDLGTVEDNSGTKLSGYISGDQLYLSNLPESATVRVYLSDGTPVYMTRKFIPGMGITLAANGIYICAVVDNSTGQEQIVKISY